LALLQKVLASYLLFVLVLATRQPASAYSMLTHEEIVDLVWADQILPLLHQRFPHATEAELNDAHAYAYGGCVIQDLGYYPFGNKDFSDFLHYVRSGDFVVAMLRDAENLDEYAFALGAVAHYVSDVEGHPAVNRAVAMDYPKLRRKFGDQVTYEDNHRAHIRTEFGFDVVQVAKNRFTSDSYRNFVGFHVSKPLLERAFHEIYGLELKDVLSNPDLSIGSYRRSVSTIIPEMIRVALLTKHAELVCENPDFDQRKFLYRLSRAEYEKEWGTQYIKSVNKTVDLYKEQLTELRKRGSRFDLRNLDFDTGRPTRPNEYKLADATYAKLMEKLAARKYDLVTPQLQANITAF
jgi:hypothetical protein